MINKLYTEKNFSHISISLYMRLSIRHLPEYLPLSTYFLSSHLKQSDCAIVMHLLP